ncbi:Na+/H+ antiporter subunit E [Geobacillus sp. NFOSA3]|jgi:multicomponent Na+:H+ antiporter subunit E|uniref:Na+/H+ antiporter subunit E n=1 Tax=Parageobacillus galactosidasius TaxID=883812 RepID=A0A226QLD9_9BACL|nr:MULTISPECIES: Na+/H+ antiporter subunit E [Parageobacillus]NNU94173.1 Na+/H+ antiporter subunit E [Geobacillus sp. NFOSA3]OQP00688.1 Na+/H+ antiporter subunit E [Geobacillus sp. 44C]MED4968890.1 Na+/H+ antiporter subunit E [Parageobacillus toebii]MED4988226.1 Na+/H+ antiporter subunit E [Parageobacillus toebii]OXB92824.1 Na+/H+ antiporter subunit E [Parageobacillus galactosidasius]
MALQILLNVLLAFVWMFLSASFNASTFIVGYILGLLIIFMLRRYFHSRFYVIPFLVICKLILIFLKELLLSNIAVLKVILAPSMNIQPCIFALPLEVKKDWEITVLSNLITLTPGTLVVDVSEDRNTLYVHALDAPNVEETIKQIKESFEKTILEVSK